MHKEKEKIIMKEESLQQRDRKEEEEYIQTRKQAKTKKSNIKIIIKEKVSKLCSIRTVSYKVV